MVTLSNGKVKTKSKQEWNGYGYAIAREVGTFNDIHVSESTDSYTIFNNSIFCCLICLQQNTQNIDLTF